MDLTGEYRIPAPRETVWAALNNPEILKACIPGCEELNKTSDTEFVARVVAKIGPVKASFGGKVTLSDIDPPNGYTITRRGPGRRGRLRQRRREGAAGLRGWRRGHRPALFRRRPDRRQTGADRLAPGGRQRQEAGGRILRRLRAQAAAAAPAAPPSAPDTTTAAADAAAAPQPVAQPAPVIATASSSGLSPVLWIIGLVVIVASILGFVALR